MLVLALLAACLLWIKVSKWWNAIFTNVKIIGKIITKAIRLSPPLLFLTFRRIFRGEVKGVITPSEPFGGGVISPP